MYRPLFAALAACALIFSADVAPAAAASTEPSIVVVRGTAVLVQVPDGFAGVYLQALTAPPKGRAVAGQKAARPQWKTVAGKKMNGTAGYVRLMAPALTPLRYLRVYGVHPKEVPPELVSSPTTSFGPDTLGEGDAAITTTAVTGSALSAGALNLAMASNSVTGATLTQAPARTVTESDIWKIAGDRLYFFNSARGLQVFDIANPDDPAMLGTLRMQGAGEEMYLLDPSHVVLLTNQTQKSGWSWSDGSLVGGGPIFTINVGIGNVRVMDGGIVNLGAINGGIVAFNQVAADAAPAQQLQLAAANVAPVQNWNGRFGIIFGQSNGLATDEHSVVVVDVKNGAPAELARVPFKGALRESRLVGNVLYLCTATNGAPGGNLSDPTLNVISFDLSDPTNPVQRGQVSFDGAEAAVYATDRYFFVAPAPVSVMTSVYSTYALASTTVEVVDISDPSGQIALAGSVEVRGFVRDKFKMNLEGNVFTVVGQDSTDPAPGYYSYFSNPVSVVSTFSLANPKAPVALATLEVAPGEALFATRYVGKRLYLVTTSPQYIDPLAIIDLSNPAKPTIIGELEVPGYSTYIEPIGDRLVTTGMQNHTAKVELYDVSDPANPTQISSLALGAPESGVNSEAVSDEKAFTVLPDEGLILLPVAAGYSWNGEGATGVQIIDLLKTGLVKRGVIQSGMSTRRATVHNGRIVSISATKLTAVDAADRDKPVVTADIDISWSVDRVLVAGPHLIEIAGTSQSAEVIVAPVDQSDTALDSLALPVGAVLAAEMRGGVLYVVQRSGNGWYNSPFIVSTIDVAHLPKLSLLGQATSAAPLSNSYGSEIRPVWVNDRTLLLTLSGYQWGQAFSRNSADAVNGIAANGIATQVIGSFSSRPRELLAVDVTTPAKPQFVSDLLVGENHSWTVGPAVAANDTVYLSYKVAPRYYYSPDVAALDVDPEQGDQNKYFLKQVDYSDSAKPVLSDARVNIPGELRALSRQGTLLYTVGAERDVASGNSLNKDFALHASSFDGTLVHLLDQLRLTSPAEPFTVSGETVSVLDAQPEQIWVPTTPPVTTQNDAVTESSAPAGALVLDAGVQLTLANVIWTGRNGSWQPNPKKSSFSTWEIGDNGKFVRRDSLKLEREVAFKQYGGLTVLRTNGPSVRFIDARDPQALKDLGVQAIEASGSSSLERAAGDLDRGLWLPLGTYGVTFVPKPDPAAAP